jgi:hypothetical protein
MPNEPMPPKTVEDYVRIARDPEHVAKGDEQEALLRIAEIMLHEGKRAHPEGSWKHDAYEAAHGLILSAHPDVDVREHGARKQFEYQKRMNAAHPRPDGFGPAPSVRDGDGGEEAGQT